MEPTLIVLIYASLAAATAGTGAAPFLVRRRLPVAWLGWANGVAAGLMLGAAYLLFVRGLRSDPVIAAVGAALGIGFVVWMHRALGTTDVDLNRVDQTPPEYGYQVLLVSTLHSAAEGVAIGAAMAVSIPFGAFLALAIALHNIPEGAVLCAVMCARGVRVSMAAALAIAANVGQVLLAIVAYALIDAAPAILPWTVGFAVGALFHLVMVELLPESYRQAGPRSIAAVTIVAMGIVVLLSGSAP
ncbi:MAG: ZIP family metal transporter [Gemmatimonadales bacterium]